MCLARGVRGSAAGCYGVDFGSARPTGTSGGADPGGGFFGWSPIKPIGEHRVEAPGVPSRNQFRDIIAH